MSLFIKLLFQKALWKTNKWSIIQNQKTPEKQVWTRNLETSKRALKRNKRRYLWINLPCAVRKADGIGVIYSSGVKMTLKARKAPMETTKSTIKYLLKKRKFKNTLFWPSKFGARTRILWHAFYFFPCNNCVPDLDWIFFTKICAFFTKICAFFIV